MRQTFLDQFDLIAACTMSLEAKIAALWAVCDLAATMSRKGQLPSADFTEIAKVYNGKVAILS